MARGRKSVAGLMTDRGLSTVSLHKMLGWPVITPRTPETRRKEEFRIISRLKRVIESFINKRVSCDLFEVKRGFLAFFYKMQCDVWAPPLGKTHTLFPYLWQESKLNTNQYFVWFGEISLKITFVRASNHRQEAEETMNRGGFGDLMTTTHYRPISIFDMREGAQKQR